MMKPGRSTTFERLAGTATQLSAYALVVPEISGGLYLSLLGGFEAAANERYRQAIICNTQDNLHRQGDELLQLIHKRVSGIAMVPVSATATPALHVEAVQAAGIPVVLLHRDVPGTSAPLVALPLEEAAHAAGRAMIERGHRRIAMFAGREGPSSLMHRDGLTRALEESGLTLPESHVRFCHGLAPFQLAEAEAFVSAALDELMAMPAEHRPTAIYATIDTVAEMLYMQLMSRGLRIPADLSLVSFGSQQRNGAIVSRLTSVVVDESAVGRSAVELLERPATEGAMQHSNGRIRMKVSFSLLEGVTLKQLEQPSAP